MRYISYLDPFFDFETIEKMLEEIELLIAEKSRRLETEWDAWIKNNEEEKVNNPDYYDHVVDGFVDDQYLISELERNLLNGVALTLGTVFERHIGFIARKIGEKHDSIYNPKKRLVMRDFSIWFPVFMGKSKHPNHQMMTPTLLDDLQAYVNVRNILTHNDGFVGDKDEDIRQFVKSNDSLFLIKNEQLWQISVKGEYIRRVIKDQKEFFKLVCYTKSGDVIY